MLEIETTAESGAVTMRLIGRLDVHTAEQLKDESERAIVGARSLVLDCADLTYISSAGLRIFLTLHRQMESRDGLVIRNVQPEVMSILTMTGFSDFLTIA